MHNLRLDFGSQKTHALTEIHKCQEELLGDFLRRFPAHVSEPLPAEWLALPLRAFTITPIQCKGVALPALPEAAAPPSPPAAPAGLLQELDAIHAAFEHAPPPPPPPPVPATTPPQAAAPAVAPPAPPPLYASTFPADLTDSEAVAHAYAEEIQKIGNYLSNHLSVLVVCDKVLAEHVYRHAVKQSQKKALLEGEEPHADQTTSGGGSSSGGGGMLQQELAGHNTRIARLGRMLAGIKANQVLVLRHLDMLAGGSAEGPLTPEARLLTEVLYRSQEFTPTLLGFSDPSLGLPKVLADRFAVRIELAGLSRDVIHRLLTRQEFERFKSFEAEMLFKNVSGFNAIQLRNAMRYLSANSRPATPTDELMKLIRQFKRGSGEEVEIPDVSFNNIGGYEAVKAQLFEAIELITGKPPAFNPDGSSCTAQAAPSARPESEAERKRRRKLAPRGFIFHGPPGTGKTLFAKAIANAMNATIQMISGPEIMDMWVGKSESNLRRIFAIARRNAPAVIFFDEFDSIAAQRSGSADGGSRASNAVVAQLLTELDGFHEDQDILVIGTTNRLDIIDEALLRPSRFQPIEIPLPDDLARHKIAAIHAAGFDTPLPDPYLLNLIAEHTDQFNGDEIRAIFQAIARLVRQNRPISAETYGIEIGLIRKRRDERQVSHIGLERRR